MKQSIVIASIILFGCGGIKESFLSTDRNKPQAYLVVNNPAVLSSVFDGMVDDLIPGPDYHDDTGHVEIYEVNEIKIDDDNMRVLSGPGKVGLAYHAKGKRSRGVLYLTFDAEPNAEYSIVWNVSGAGGMQRSKTRKRGAQPEAAPDATRR